jgi:hypothetical protein
MVGCKEHKKQIFYNLIFQKSSAFYILVLLGLSVVYGADDNLSQMEWSDPDIYNQDHLPSIEDPVPFASSSSVFVSKGYQYYPPLTQNSNFYDPFSGQYFFAPEYGIPFENQEFSSSVTFAPIPTTLETFTDPPSSTTDSLQTVTASSLRVPQTTTETEVLPTTSTTSPSIALYNKYVFTQKIKQIRNFKKFLKELLFPKNLARNF